MQEGTGTNQREESKDVTTNDCITEEEAIEGNLKKITILAEDQTKYNPMAFLKSKEDTIKSTLREELNKRLRIKFYLTLQVRFNKIKGDQVQTTAPFFHGKYHIVLKKEDIDFALRESHVNLLVITKDDKSHYCRIKNFNRLLFDQHNDNNQYHYCHYMYCLHGFTKKTLLDKHIPCCQVHGAQRTEMPDEDNKWLKYTDVSKQLKSPYVVYADFECIVWNVFMAVNPTPRRRRPSNWPNTYLVDLPCGGPHRRPYGRSRDI